jgi:SAM-dependent methyltransferase
MSDDVIAQRRYYEATVGRYDSMHSDENVLAFEYMARMIRSMDVRSVLDVGAGTGRALSFLSSQCPDIELVGVEPVRALLDRAPVGRLVEASGDSLPFCDRSFDAVCETAVLHHVPDPAILVREMLRVARRVVVLADANRFGQGPMWKRLMKVGLWRTSLWGAYTHLRTKGKGSLYSEGDGVFWSYSVYDSLPLLRDWADRMFVLPTHGSSGIWTGPLLSAEHVLAVGLRDREV